MKRRLGINTKSKVGHVGVTKCHATSFEHALNDWSISTNNVVLQRNRALGCGVSRKVQVHLHRKGNPVKRTEWCTALHRSVSGVGASSDFVGINFNNCVNGFVDVFDSTKMRFNYVSRCCLATPDFFSECCCRFLPEFFRHDFSQSFLSAVCHKCRQIF